MSSLLIAVFVILLSGLLEILLLRRQAGAAIRHRDGVPAAFVHQVSLDEHQKAADYTVAHSRLGEIQVALDGAVSILWLTVLLGPYYHWLSAWIAPGLTRSVVMVLGVTLISSLTDLPLSLYNTFRIEAAFGFNRTTPRLFAVDQAKQLLLSLLLAGPLLAGLFWLLDTVSAGWWLWAWGGFMGVFLLLNLAYPRLIAPLFNKFEPLAEGETKDRIEALLQRCGFRSGGLYVMDASRRSGHGNAYFAGFGRTKRIVLFDTLLAKHGLDEIEAVLAHELGHFKHGHILQRLGGMAGIAFLAFAALGWAFGANGLAAQFGFPNDPGLVLVIGMLALGMVLRLLSPLFNGLSRRAEFQADAFARTMVGAEPMAAALTRLARDNAATLTPDPLYTLFHYSHPPIAERVARLGG